MMAQHYNRFSQYNAPHQSNQQPLQQSQSYATYGPVRSTQESIVAPQYQSASGSTSNAYSFANRYQTSSNSGTYSTSQQAANWTGSSSNNYSQPYSRNDDATGQNRPGSPHYQPSSYDTQYGTSGLGNLAYASTLSTGNANRNIESTETTHPDRYENLNHQRIAEGYGTGHNANGHQQTRPDSVNSVRSRQSNASPAMRQASANSLHQSQAANNASPRYSHQTQVQQPYQPQSNQSTVTYQTSTTPTYARSNNRRLSQPQSASQRSPSSVSHRNNPSYQSPQVSRNQIETDRQHSASTEPTTPMTVDPSQVYDPYYDIQRQKRQAEVDATARQREQQRRATEAAQNKGDQEQVPQSNAPAQDQSIISGSATNTSNKRRLQSDSVSRSKDAQPKAKRKKKAQPVESNDEAMRGAAMALMQTANGSASAGDLETQMREMFKKMREFNEKDPNLLSKLWQEERDTHLDNEKQQTQAEQSDQPAPTQSDSQATQPQKEKEPNTKKSTMKKATPKKAGKSTSAQATQKPSSAKGKPAPTAAIEKSKPTLSTSQPQSQPQPQTQSQSKPAQSSQSSHLPSAKETGSKGTVWPADKKAALASAAASLVSKMPANAGKPIQPIDISLILDKNPSYVDLCKLIEDKGYSLDRSQFAKALLSAVPDVNNRSYRNTAQGQSGQQENTVRASNPISPSTGNHSGFLGDAEARLMEGESVVDTPSKKSVRQSKKRVNQIQPVQDAAEDIATNDVAAPALGPELEGLGPIKAFVEVKDGQQPNESAPSKSKSYKKKETAQPEPQHPLSKEDNARKRSFADLVDLTQISEDETENFPPPAPAGESPAASNAQSPFPTTPQTTMPQQHSLQQHPMAVPAAQMQPSSYPPLPTQFSNQASAKQQNMRLPPADHPIQRTQVALPLDKHRALRRSNYNPKTIARDVLLATGRHPDMRHLNAHYDQLKQVFQGLQSNGADLSTIRWDVIDPNGPGPGAGLALLPDVMDEMMADDEESDAGSALDEPTHHDQDVSTNGVGLATHGVHGPVGPAGRGKKNKFRQSDPGFRGAADSTPNKPRTVPQPTSEKPSGYTALRATDPETGQKKKGRPIGWRKWMQKDFAGEPGGDGDKGPPRRPGRPPLKPSEPKPNYQIFKCLWQVPRPECGCQLHNLDTLRQHVHKIHGKNLEYPMQSGNMVYLCQWQGCGRAVPVNDGSRTVSRMEPRAFANLEEWKRHFETKHIRPVAWELGDGPAGGVSDREGSELSDAYLSDRQGRRVTPRVALPDSTERTAAASVARGGVRPGQQPPRAVGKQNKTMEDEARIEEYGAQEQRARMGASIDREGVRTLGGKGSEKRRMGFIDDDDEGPQLVETDD